MSSNPIHGINLLSLDGYRVGNENIILASLKNISEMKTGRKRRCMEDGTGTQISPISEFLKID